MAMDFLRRIERAALPLVLRDESDVRSTIVLEAAELIEAQLPAVDAPFTDAKAIISQITPQGRAAISKVEPSSGRPGVIL